jgi:hypothetical protein
MTSRRGVVLAAGSLFLFALGTCSPGPGADRGLAVVLVSGDDLVTFQPPDALAGVADLMAGAGGSVVVLNTTEPFLLEFDSAGDLRGSWGRRGDGPGELRMPVALVGRAGGREVWVYDRGRHALVPSWAQEPLEFEAEVVRLPRESLPPGRLVSFDDMGMAGDRPWIRPWDDGFLLARARQGFELGLGIWSAEILRLDVGTGALSLAADPASVLGDPSRRFPDALYIVPIPIWDLCPDGSFALYTPSSNEVTRIRGDGTGGVPVALPPERRLETTRERVFELLYRYELAERPDLDRSDSLAIRAGFDAEYRALGPLLSPVFPEYVDLQCDDRDVIWLQRFDPAGPDVGRGPTWLRIAMDRPTLEVRLPERLRRVHFAGGRAWGVVLDAMDVPAPARVAVP